VTNGATPVENKTQALKDLNWPTLVLILFTGGTNFLATQKGSTEREYQVDQAVKQIRELHEALDDFQKRQKQGLENTTQILEHDTILLKEVHTISMNLERWKNEEQNRGAPP
jgi:hypothetical protein